MKNVIVIVFVIMKLQSNCNCIRIHLHVIGPKSAPIRMNILDIRNKEDYSVCLETVFISEELYMKILVVVVAAEE